MDEIHTRRQHEFAVLVAVLVLGDEKGHRPITGRLLVQVDNLSLTRDSVADHDRLVVLELLLAVEHDAASGHELADDFHRRVPTRVRIRRLVLAERTPERGGGEEVRRRYG